MTCCMFTRGFHLRRTRTFFVNQKFSLLWKNLNVQDKNGVALDDIYVPREILWYYSSIFTYA